MPQAWCSRAEGSIPHGAELSTEGLEERAAGRCEDAGGGLWYDQFLYVGRCVPVDGYVCE